MSSEVAIRIENLSKSYSIYVHSSDRLKQFLLSGLSQLLGAQHKRYYHDFWALNEISLEVKKGEVVGIIGRNGSGKSTLLQVICGTLTPTRGQVVVNGRVAALLELGSGFNPEFTGRENIYMNAAVLGLSKGEIDERYEEIIRFAELGNFIDQPVKTYSTGMTMRLAFSVIAHVSADILIIDEALSVGDAFFTQKCMRFLRKFMENGTILFVSHDINAVVNLCNRAILMNEGTIFHAGCPKEVTEIFFAREHSTQQRLTYKDNIPVKALNEEGIILGEAQGNVTESPNIGSAKQVNNFENNRSSISAGVGGAEIISSQLTHANECSQLSFSGGELVNLRIVCRAFKDLDKPIIGFELRDRLGQIIFADNTFLTYSTSQFRLSAGEEIAANFKFILPFLLQGDYTISLAIANGDQDSHTIMHWVYDALLITISSSCKRFGIISVPMIEISLSNMLS